MRGQSGKTLSGKQNAIRAVAAACKKEGISLTGLRSGSRRGKLPAVRVKIVQALVEDYGVPIAEVARQVGISRRGSAVELLPVEEGPRREG